MRPVAALERRRMVAPAVVVLAAAATLAVASRLIERRDLETP